MKASTIRAAAWLALVSIVVALVYIPLGLVVSPESPVVLKLVTWSTLFFAVVTGAVYFYIFRYVLVKVASIPSVSVLMLALIILDLFYPLAEALSLAGGSAAQGASQALGLLLDSLDGVLLLAFGILILKSGQLLWKLGRPYGYLIIVSAVGGLSLAALELIMLVSERLGVVAGSSIVLFLGSVLSLLGYAVLVILGVITTALGIGILLRAAREVEVAQVAPET